MDSVKYVYDGKLWKASSTVSDKNSFFHAAFGVRATEDEPYLDKRVKFRRRRWSTFLSYFEGETMPPHLINVLNDCLSATMKYKHVSVEDQEQFDGYVLDITKAEHDVTIQEIPILATLDNVKVVLFKDRESEPAIVINPNSEFLGSYPNMEKPKGEVILHVEGNTFSRMDNSFEDSASQLAESGGKIADESVVQLYSGFIRYKKGETAGIEGVQFQVGLLVVVFLNALQKLNNWKLSTENEVAGKFDDVVMEWPEGATLLQAKHKQNKSKIRFEELMSTNSKNDDFSIPKYFLSYEEVKKTFKLREVIICTNAGVDRKAMKFLNVRKAGPESLLHCEYCDCPLYTFSDEILPFLRENVKIYYEKNYRNKGVDESVITEENLKDFLGHLQLFFNYPHGNDIGKVTEQLLSRMKLLGNLYADVSHLDVHGKILEWFRQKDGVYITELYAKAIFSEIWRDKHWQSLQKHEIFFQHDNLNLQTSKRLFHFIVEGGSLLQETRIFRALHSSKTKFLYVSPSDGMERQKHVIEAFVMPQYTILVLVWPKDAEEYTMRDVSCRLRDVLDKFGYKKVVLVADCNNKVPQLIGLSNDNYDVVNESLTLNILSEVCRERLLVKENILFQGSPVSLKELFVTQATEDFAKFLNTEELEKLVRGETVKVGAAVPQLDEHVAQFYINRKFKRPIKNAKGKLAKSATREEIVPEELICEIKEKVVLISDDAGTGKSTVLTNLAITMKKKYPHLWVIRINLNDYTGILKEFLAKNNGTVNVLELLDSKRSTKFTNHLERSVFSMKERVVLMFDGFDEIGPDYTQLVLNLLSLSLEQQNFAKVIVTTRPYMAGELEKTLQVKLFLLEPFTEQNQIDFLVGYWMHELDVCHTERGKCEEYAKALIEKMASWLRVFYNKRDYFGAVPLHVRMVAEIFLKHNRYETSEDWSSCKEYLLNNETEPNLPANMNVTRLYKMFIEKKRSVFVEKGNPRGNTASNQALLEQFEDSLVYHRNLALKLIFSKAKCELFLCRGQTPRNIETNMLKIGIVQKVDNEFHFVHRTFAEYFVAESLVEELRLPNENIGFQKFFVEEILVDYHFQLICVFSNNFLQHIVDDLSSKTFYNYQCSSYEITMRNLEQFHILHNLASNGNLAILQLILKCFDSRFAMEIPGDYLLQALSENKFPKYGNILNILLNYAQQKRWEIKGVYLRQSPLVEAVPGGHFEMVKFLVEQGADVNTGIFKPLQMAIIIDHFEMAQFLIEHGADITAHLTFVIILLYQAVMRKDLAATTFLMDRLLENEELDVTDYDVPYLAAHLGRIDALEKLVKRGLDVNGTKENGDGLISGAALGGRLETIKYLVQQGCDINSRDREGNTALHLISRNSSFLSVAKLLVEQGIDVNAKNSKCSTALHISVEAYNIDLTRVLLDCGADTTVEDAEGNTFIHLVNKCLEKIREISCSEGWENQREE